MTVIATVEVFIPELYWSYTTTVRKKYQKLVVAMGILRPLHPETHFILKAFPLEPFVHSGLL